MPSKSRTPALTPATRHRTVEGEPKRRAGSASRGATTESKAAAPTAEGSHRVEFVQSLERGFAVVRAFGPERTHLSVADVAQATGLTRAVARRFLLTLVELGYVRNEGRVFLLRPRILELGNAYLSGLAFPDLARPFMEELSGKVQESTSAAVLDGDEIVYVANVVPRRVMTINVPIGGRDPAYCTALGRVLLAQRSDQEIDLYLKSVPLERVTANTITDPAKLKRILGGVRTKGYALVNQEFENGLVAVAVPVHDVGGATVAAMNVSAYSLRASAMVLERDFLPLLRATVSELEAELRSVQLKVGPPIG